MARLEPAKGLTLPPPDGSRPSEGWSSIASVGKGGIVTMGIPATTHALATGGFALILSASHFSPVWAQEYCVACSGPDALYRCVFDNAVPTGMPLKLLCTATLAHEGGHATCSVKGGTVFDCNAPIRRIDATVAANALRTPLSPPPDQPRVPYPVIAPVVQDTVRPASAPPGADAPTPAPAKAQPASSPQTVEQLAKDMTRASKESFEKAGTTISGTTRKAWDCIRSFLKSC